MLGDMAIPMGLLVLGGSLWQHRANTRTLPPALAPWVLLLNAFARLVIMAASTCLCWLYFRDNFSYLVVAVGIGIVIAFKSLNILPSNPELIFVLIIESGVPAAVNLMVLASLSEDKSVELVLGSLMIYHYTLCLVTLIIIITVAVEFVL